MIRYSNMVTQLVSSTGGFVPFSFTLPSAENVELWFYMLMLGTAARNGTLSFSSNNRQDIRANRLDLRSEPINVFTYTANNLPATYSYLQQYKGWEKKGWRLELDAPPQSLVKGQIYLPSFVNSRDIVQVILKETL